MSFFKKSERYNKEYFRTHILVKNDEWSELGTKETQ